MEPSGTIPVRSAELAGWGPFVGLDGAELEALTAVAETVALRAGTRIFNLGEEADAITVVKSGTVALTLPLVVRGTSREVTLDEKGPGAVIAWSALVPPHKLTMSGTAATDVTLVRFPRSALGALFEKNSALHIKVLRNLNRVIANRVALLEALLLRDLQRWASEQ